MEIKSNPELFNKWKHLGSEITRINAIVQNNIETTPEEVKEWMDKARNLKCELETLIQETESYALKNARP